MDIARIVGAIDSSRGLKTLKAYRSDQRFGGNASRSKGAKPLHGRGSSDRFNQCFCTDLRVFEVLSRADYFQTLKLTQAFNDKALGLVAELAVVRAGLSK
jgi:hypothetical protein